MSADAASGLQSGLAVLSWAALGLSLAASIRKKWLKPFAFGLILAFSLSLDVSQWDRMWISESISSSFLALLIALWLWGARLATKGQASSASRLTFVIFTALVTALYSFSRDSNAYFLLSVALLMLPGLLLKPVRRHPSLRLYLGLVLWMVLIFGLQLRSADAGQRWVTPLYNVLYFRILPLDDERLFFESRGMPLNDEIMEFHSLGRSPFLRALRGNSEVRRLAAWAKSKGRATYVRYLLSKPLLSVRRPLADYYRILGPNLSVYRKPLGGDPAWLKWISSSFYPRSPIFVGVPDLVLALALILLGYKRRFDPAWIVPFLLLATSYPLTFVIWHGDAIELERHAFQVSLQLRLAGWIMLPFGVDSLLRSQVS